MICPPSLQWTSGERMIDEYFLRVRLDGQNQIRYLLGKDISCFQESRLRSA